MQKKKEPPKAQRKPFGPFPKTPMPKCLRIIDLRRTDTKRIGRFNSTLFAMLKREAKTSQEHADYLIHLMDILLELRDNTEISNLVEGRPRVKLAKTCSAPPPFRLLMTKSILYI